MKKLDRKFSEYLANLKEDRETGDYGTEAPVEKVDAEKAFREAEAFVTEAEKYLQPFLKQSDEKEENQPSN